MCDLGTGRNEIGPLLGWFKSHSEEEDEEWTLWTIGIWLSYWHRRGNPCILRKQISKWEMISEEFRSTARPPLARQEAVLSRWTPAQLNGTGNINESLYL